MLMLKEGITEDMNGRIRHTYQSVHCLKLFSQAEPNSVVGCLGEIELNSGSGWEDSV